MKGVLVLLVIIGVSTCLPAGSPDAANQDSQAIANGAVDSEMEDRMPPCIPGSCVMEITVNDRLGKKVKGVLVLLVIIGVSTCLPAGSPDAANQDSQAIANGAVDSEMDNAMEDRSWSPCMP